MRERCLSFLVMLTASHVASGLQFASRRVALETVTSTLLVPGAAYAAAPVYPEGATISKRPLAYKIEAGDPTMMQPFEGRAVQQVLGNIAQSSDVVLIGVGRGDAEDLELAAKLASEFCDRARRQKRRVVMGLDVAPYDSVVSPSEAASWPAVGNDPSVLDPLWRVDCDEVVGLGVEGDTLRKVQSAGIAALSDAERAAYVDDPQLFASFPTTTKGFELYAQRCVSRRYEERYGGSQAKNSDLSASGYFATSILQDEAVATCCARQLRKIEAPQLLVAVVNSDRVQFKLGSQARLQQKKFNVASVLVNPSATSTFSASSRLRLGLTEDIGLEFRTTTLADFVWFSKSPPPSLLNHMLNPIDGAFKIDFGLSTGGTATI